jgi:hypothetical protein
LSHAATSAAESVRVLNHTCPGVSSRNSKQPTLRLFHEAHPQHRYGGRIEESSAYSLMASATSFGIAAGPLVGGALGALSGLRPDFLLTASVLILVALVVATTVREPSAAPAAEPPRGVQRRNG